ncbi:hypothetical protein ACFQVC_21810 [Streptomyces monticola]|uniref:Uncharacterized protein n=1 Tax=Streptomyces monticola TaxID=2666263 RepID=A0ABW2JL51_9ACTN
MGVLGACIADLWAGGVAAWWPLGVFVLLLAMATARNLDRVNPEPRRKSILMASVLSGILTLFVLGLGAGAALAAPTRPYGSRILLVLALAFAMVNGLRLLVRQVSWRHALPWLLPALLPVVLGFVPGIGMVVHFAYLDAFGLHVEDIDVPKIHQFLAFMKMMAMLSGGLFPLSLWGYAKHFHLMLSERTTGYLVLAVLAVTVTAQVVWIVLAPAFNAGAQAVAAAAAGRTPTGYFGIEPQWVCASPVGMVDEVPVEGESLAPSRPYLLIGDSAGTAALWDSRKRGVIKAPLSKIRLFPSDAPRGRCGGQ